MEPTTQKRGKSVKKKTKQINRIEESISKVISHFAEDHGLHTLFIFVMIILISLFVVVLAYYFLK